MVVSLIPCSCVLIVLLVDTQAYASMGFPWGDWREYTLVGLRAIALLLSGICVWNECKMPAAFQANVNVANALLLPFFLYMIYYFCAGGVSLWKELLDLRKSSAEIASVAYIWAHALFGAFGVLYLCITAVRTRVTSVPTHQGE
tara:strand:- start:7103 stop:7534 length:432 start_codon:yes stop_codon:yes gene_type:complete